MCDVYVKAFSEVFLLFIFLTVSSYDCRCKVSITKGWIHITAQPPSISANISPSPCYFSPLSEIPGSIELLENSLTYEGVQWRKIIECHTNVNILRQSFACSFFPFAYIFESFLSRLLMFD